MQMVLHKLKKILVFTALKWVNYGIFEIALYSHVRFDMHSTCLASQILSFSYRTYDITTYLHEHQTRPEWLTVCSFLVGFAPNSDIAYKTTWYTIYSKLCARQAPTKDHRSSEKNVFSGSAVIFIQLIW